MRWAGHVARMAEKRGAGRILVGRSEGRRPLGRSKRIWDDNIKMYLKAVGMGAWTGLSWLNSPLPPPPSRYSVSTGDLTSGLKRLGREAEHSPLSAAEVSEWSCTSAPRMSPWRAQVQPYVVLQFYVQSDPFITLRKGQYSGFSNRGV
jgi:hypothetical protein